MTTAFEYRQYARECMDSARDATSEAARTQFLDIAKLWLTAAAGGRTANVVKVDEE
jgi:hypothetical protein